MEELTSAMKDGLIERGLKQINVRGLAVPHNFWGYVRKHIKITDRSRKPSMWVLHYNAYTKYSSRESWWVSASYLCGHSDGSDWAVRIPSTIREIDEAIDWLTPAQVKKAIKERRDVKRQGDMYFIPMRISWHDFHALINTRHRNIFDNRKTKERLIIVHPEHPDIELDSDKRWKAIQQRQLGVGNVRVGAD